MKNALALIAIAGIATAASAQDFSLSIVNAPAIVAEGSSFSFDVVGDASIGTHLLGGAFSVVSDSGLIASMTWDNASWDQFPSDGGYAGNGNYNVVVFGQLVIPGVPPFDQPGAGSQLGGVIGTFHVTLNDTGTGDIDFSLVGGSPFALEVVDVSGGSGGNSSQGTLTLNGATVTVTPAPSALALLGLGGLAAGRRRR